MHAKLLCKTGTFAGCEFIIAEEAIIGRDAVNDISIAEPTITNSHARIYFDAQQSSYFIEDLASRNGTTVDGVPVTGYQRLDKLHVITLARKIDLIFVVSNKDLPERMVANGKQTVMSGEGGLRQTSFKNALFSLPKFFRKQPSSDPKKTRFGDGFDD